jgi:hypothetical protein
MGDDTASLCTLFAARFNSIDVATADSAAMIEFTADAGSAQAANVLLSLRGGTPPPGLQLERLPSVLEGHAAGVVPATVQDHGATRARSRVQTSSKSKPSVR